MSSARQGDGPSGASDLGLSELLASRGAPLLEALAAHHAPSRERSDAAASYAFAAAVELGMSREGAELVRDVTRLQEVGLVYVPAEALTKPSAELTPSEQSRFAARYDKGSQLARGAGLPDQVCDWLRLGAERYDGRGPHGLAGAAIPLQARIAAASYACYAALAEAQATPGADPASILRARASAELDPRVVEALAAVLARVG